MEARRRPGEDAAQAFYAGLRKPRELEDDTQVCRAYLEAADRITERGDRFRRVVLDHELKREYQRFLQERNRGRADSDGRPDRSAEEVALWAVEHHLPYFGEQVHFPDVRDRRVGPDEEQALLEAALTVDSEEHKWAGASMHDRIIGALETCCRKGEMLRIQNRHVDWERFQIAIPGANAKDSENRRVPFDPQGRLAPILKRRKKLGPSAFLFGGPEGEFQDSFKAAWESLLLRANGFDITRAKKGARVGREKLREIDLHWHDLRHEGACRLLADGVDIRTIQLMLGHADIKQTQRYLNITHEELRRAMTGVWERRRQLRLAVGSSRPEPAEDDKAAGE